jgi:hypothetical protein
MSVALTIPVITDDMSQPEAALALATGGIYVFPVDHPDLAQCAGMRTASHDPATCPADERGKHPVLKFTVGADVNPKMIHMWWAGGPRNVGVYMAKSGLLVIDEDRPDAFAKYAADHGVEIPPTFHGEDRERPPLLLPGHRERRPKQP